MPPTLYSFLSPARSGMKATAQISASITSAVTIILLVGLTCAFSAAAETGPGLRSASEFLTQGSKADPERKYRNLYAVVIGIGRYENLGADGRIPSATENAHAIAELLRSNYDFAEVGLLLDRRATRANIEEVLRGFLTSTSREDALFVYWAGHGTIRTSRGQQVFSLVPFDGDSQEGRFEWRNFSTDLMFEEISRDIPAGEIFFIADTCYDSSGLTIPSDRSRPSKMFMRGVENEVDRRGFTVWKPCASKELLWQRAIPSLGESITEVLGSQKSVFSAADLINQVQRIAEDSAPDPEARKSATEWKRPIGSATLTFVPDPARAPTARTMLGNIQFNTNLIGAEIFLDGQAVGLSGPERVFNLRDIPAGTHEIKILKEGHAPVVRSIDVPVDQWVQVSAVLYLESGEETTDSISPEPQISSGTISEAQEPPPSRSLVPAEEGSGKPVPQVVKPLSTAPSSPRTSGKERQATASPPAVSPPKDRTSQGTKSAAKPLRSKPAAGKKKTAKATQKPAVAVSELPQAVPDEPPPAAKAESRISPRQRPPSRKQPAKIDKSLLRKAKSGDPEAQAKLAWIYAQGISATKNDEEAVRLYRNAAEQGLRGLPIAQYNLGVMYSTGRGVDRDPGQATKWYRKAANQGFPYAQYNLGVMYANGTGAKKSEAKAVEWYLKAAEQGLPQAQFTVGMRYRSGRGLPKDSREGAKWLSKSAGQGYEPAQRVLARKAPSRSPVPGRVLAASKTLPEKRSQDSGPAVDNSQPVSSEPSGGEAHEESLGLASPDLVIAGSTYGDENAAQWREFAGKKSESTDSARASRLEKLKQASAASAKPVTAADGASSSSNEAGSATASGPSASQASAAVNPSGGSFQTTAAPSGSALPSVQSPQGSPPEPGTSKRSRPRVPPAATGSSGKSFVPPPP